MDVRPPGSRDRSQKGLVSHATHRLCQFSLATVFWPRYFGGYTLAYATGVQERRREAAAEGAGGRWEAGGRTKKGGAVEARPGAAEQQHAPLRHLDRARCDDARGGRRPPGEHRRAVVEEDVSLELPFREIHAADVACRQRHSELLQGLHLVLHALVVLVQCSQCMAHVRCSFRGDAGFAGS